MEYLLSICIPTYNRDKYLSNLLESIISNVDSFNFNVEICISDNGSTDDTEVVVKKASERIRLKYKRNGENLGIPQNFLNVVEMAEGKYAWLIGDDDLLMGNSLDRLFRLLKSYPSVDFFYVNAFLLNKDFIFNCPQPFDIENLPNSMKPFSSYQKTGELPFIDLINPKISFDFLGGMYLSVFRREKWLKNINALNPLAVTDKRTFSHFDNTFPHIKIFASAFRNSKAYFNYDPLIVSLSGAREWSPMYPLVRSIRLLEALKEYRKNGLELLKYIVYKNNALHYFIPDFVRMVLNREKSGIHYVNILKLGWDNFIYPNVYLSPLYYLCRKALTVLTKNKQD